MKPILVITAPRGMTPDGMKEATTLLKDDFSKIKEEYHIIFIKSPVLEEWKIEIIKNPNEKNNPLQRPA